jgi:rare lipoprotein A
MFAVAAIIPGAALAETVGVASWYGNRHDGLRTSSGETFDEEGLTAASRSIPLGSRVRVTMNDTGESVVVRVNDRMGGRAAIIDLSKGAAREIGLLGRGRAMVSITSANDEEPVEVAEATDDELADMPPVSHARHHHAHHAHSMMTAHHDSYRIPGVILARHTEQHRATQRRL